MLKMKGKSNNNAWICIYGVDAVGKIWMIENIKKSLSEHK